MLCLWLDKKYGPYLDKYIVVDTYQSAIHLTKLGQVCEINIGEGFDQYIEWLFSNVEMIPPSIETHIIGKARHEIVMNIWDLNEIYKTLHKKVAAA